jgi:hypothetical protein
MTEEDLALKIIEYLENKKFISYKEVSLRGCGGDIRSDIYFVKDNHTIAVETKLTMSLKVIEQSYRWKKYASQIYVCVPSPKYKQRNSRKFLIEVCKKMNIGVFYYDKNQIEEIFNPDINNNYKLPILHESQKDSIAGNSKSEFYTNFKNTVANIDNFMQDKSSYNLNDMIKEIKHHYSNNKSAKNSIKKMILQNIIKNYIIENNTIIRTDLTDNINI